ncbi:hypothetical protein PG996_015918 [Apiospora saccharicola]|uniref:Uncharacterized protein n=1 Tax=Apiospora saccharicola TaxID=335842 RepID=A0ABR1TQ56_9PEZI
MEKPSLIVTLPLPEELRVPAKRKRAADDDDDDPDFEPKRRRGITNRRVVDSSDEDSDASTSKIGADSVAQSDNGSDDTSMTTNDASPKPLAMPHMMPLTMPTLTKPPPMKTPFTKAKAIRSRSTTKVRAAWPQSIPLALPRSPSTAR